MYYKGHLGVSLAAWGPLGFALVALGRVDLALVAGAGMLWLSTLPDVDHRLPLVSHRGPTHSLLFAALVGGAFGAAGYLAGGLLGVDPLPAAGFGFVVGALGILAHLVGDTLTPMGVNYLWPVSGRRHSWYVTTADDRLANWALLGLGVAVAAGSLLLAVRLFPPA